MQIGKLMVAITDFYLSGCVGRFTLSGHPPGKLNLIPEKRMNKESHVN